MTEIQAVILAAGEGSRLGPIASVIPKPLLPLGGKPLIVRIARKLLDEGFSPLVFCVNEGFRDQFEYHLSQLPGLLAGGNELLSSKVPQGTAGELLNVQDHLAEEFLVYYGDIWTDASLGEMVTAWNRVREKAIAMLAVSMTLKVDKGVPKVDASGWITSISEKPDVPLANLVGIAILKKGLLKFAVSGEDLNGVVIPRAIVNGQRVHARWLPEGYDDIGSLHAYRQVDAKFRARSDPTNYMTESLG